MKSKQLGLSPIGVLAASCLFALCVILALKLTTHYIEYFQIKGIFERVVEEPNYNEIPEEDIRRRISSSLSVSGINDFKINDSAFIGNDDDGYPLLEFDYEVREHILGNVDVVLTFSWSSNPDAIVTELEE